VSEHIEELVSVLTRGMAAILVIVILTYLLWPLCTRFLELLYPAARVGSSAAQFRAVRLGGSIDLGTYWGIPLFAVSLLSLLMPGLYRRERVLTRIYFSLAVILYYVVPPFAIWAISTKVFPWITDVLAVIGIHVTADTAAVNSIFIALAFIIMFPIYIIYLHR